MHGGLPTATLTTVRRQTPVDNAMIAEYWVQSEPNLILGQVN